MERKMVYIRKENLYLNLFDNLYQSRYTKLIIASDRTYFIKGDMADQTPVKQKSHTRERSIWLSY